MGTVHDDDVQGVGEGGDQDEHHSGSRELPTVGSPIQQQNAEEGEHDGYGRGPGELFSEENGHDGGYDIVFERLFFEDIVKQTSPPTIKCLKHR